jgi:hypothetical protein
VNTRISELGGAERATVVRSRVVRGRYTIAVVAFDGTPSGLSADGRTLVLINPRRRFPRTRTAFAVLDTRTLEARTTLDFEGDYSFDALSPDGRWLYLIQYTSRRDPQRYAVRAYDLHAGRMLPKPIVDPTEPDEAMRGYPTTRNGRWEYTLYDGGGSHPFVHARDTVARKALCLDLDVLEGDSNFGNLGLRPEPGGKITVHYRGVPMAFIDRETRRVTAPPLPQSPARERTSRPEPLPRGVQITLIAFLALVIVASAGALAVSRRRDGPRDSDDEHWYPAP